MTTTPAQSRRVLITGTSTGFGNSAAQAFASRGHTVLATMRGVDGKNRAKAEALRSWAAQGGHKLHVIDMDVTSDASVQAGVTRALELAGGIDAAINNAGIGTVGITESFTPDEVAQYFQTNVVGSFRVARAVLPVMRESKAGYLVFVSSSLGRVVLPFMGPYTASKFALEALAETMAPEVKPLGIDLTILEPGVYATSFLENTIFPSDRARADRYGPVKQGFDAFLQNYQGMATNGMMGKPSEIADAMVRLVENPADRQLRVNIDGMLGQGVTAINQTCAQVQAATMAALSGPR